MTNLLSMTIGVVFLVASSASFAQEVIIDSHTHLMPPGHERGLNLNVDASPEELRRQMKEANELQKRYHDNAAAVFGL